MHASVLDEEAHTVLLTGRRGVVAHAVRRWLRSQGFNGNRVRQFPTTVVNNHEEPYTHDEYFKDDLDTDADYPRNGKTGNPSNQTIVFKQWVVEKLVHPDLKGLEIWEDRDDHISAMISIMTKLKDQIGIDKTILHRVYKPEIPGGQPYIQHIPV